MTQLAKKVGIDRSYVSYIESGDRLAPPELLAKIGRALEQSPKVIKRWQEERYAPEIAHEVGSVSNEAKAKIIAEFAFAHPTLLYVLAETEEKTLDSAARAINIALTLDPPYGRRVWIEMVFDKNL